MILKVNKGWFNENELFLSRVACRKRRYSVFIKQKTQTTKFWLKIVHFEIGMLKIKKYFP